MHVHILNIESMKPTKKGIFGGGGERRPPSPPPPQFAPLIHRIDRAQYPTSIQHDIQSLTCFRCWHPGRDGSQCMLNCREPRNWCPVASPLSDCPLLFLRFLIETNTTSILVNNRTVSQYLKTIVSWRLNTPPVISCRILDMHGTNEGVNALHRPKNVAIITNLYTFRLWHNWHHKLSFIVFQENTQTLYHIQPTWLNNKLQSICCVQPCTRFFMHIILGFHYICKTSLMTHEFSNL